MGFSANHRLNVVARVLLIVFTALVMVWGFVDNGWQMTPLVCAVLLVLMVIELVRYQELTVRRLSQFLQSVRHHDFASGVPAGDEGRAHGDLAQAYRQLTGEFQKINTEKQAGHQLLESLVEHVSFALLCLNRRNDIILMNQAAKDLFRLPYAATSRSFSRLDPAISHFIEESRDRERNLVTLNLGDDVLQLAMSTTTFTLLEEDYVLVSFQNIRDELEQREVTSWQRLIRVLTHEIMNSVTPIVSLSSVLSERMLSADRQTISTEGLSLTERTDLARSLLAIQTRGQGLMDFVTTYSTLANMPKPVPAAFRVCELLERICTLKGSELAGKGISLRVQCDDPDLTVVADATQVEQVLINLVNNARDVLADWGQEREVLLSAAVTQNGDVRLGVKDTGPGIPPDVRENIFVPFYTTRKNGTGVGLSLSRQLMQANRGHITVRSESGKGTEFILGFPPARQERSPAS